MVNDAPEADLRAILRKFDRSSPEALLETIAAEFIRLHGAYRNLLARVVALEVTQTLSDRIAAAESFEGELASQVYIEADTALSSEAGFYPLEYDASGGAYRWTGPGAHFHFELFLNRGAPARLCLRYSQIFMNAPGEVVRCYVDGEEIETETFGIGSEFELRGEIPARAGNGGTVVSFTCRTAPLRGDAGEVAGGKKLGLAFRWLKIDRTAGEEFSDALEADGDEDAHREHDAEADAPIFGPTAGAGNSHKRKAPRKARRARAAMPAADAE